MDGEEGLSSTFSFCLVEFFFCWEHGIHGLLFIISHLTFPRYCCFMCFFDVLHLAKKWYFGDGIGG